MEEMSRYFGQIVNHHKDGVMVVDSRGKIVMVNPAMTRMSGFTEEEMVDSPCTILDCDACDIFRSEAKKEWCGLFVRQSVYKKHCSVKGGILT